MNDHTTAVVPIETWAFQSPRLRRGGQVLDVGLLAEALIYYDRVLVVPSTYPAGAKVLAVQPPISTGPEPPETPQFVHLIDWFVQHGCYSELLGLLRHGGLRRRRRATNGKRSVTSP